MPHRKKCHHASGAAGEFSSQYVAPPNAAIASTTAK